MMYWARYLLWILLAAAVLGCGNYVECCVEEERLALLAIKAYMQSYSEVINDPDDPPSLYNSSKTDDCCEWDGVRCNASTGRITELDLGFEVRRNDTSRRWIFNVTLFRPFRQLTSLDLSSNLINGWIKQDGFCKLKSLVELHLQYNQLDWVLPACIQNLSSLQFLDLSHNNLRGKFPKVLSSMRSLEHLDISYNYFEGKFSLTCLANLSKLHSLWLSGNTLQVGLGGPSWGHKFQLGRLGLGGCNHNNTFDTFHRFWSLQTNLSHIDLSNNNLVSQAFPVWLFHNNSKLTALYLGNNSLTGNLDELPRTGILNLQILDISDNNLHGKLPESIGLMFPRLLYLNLSGNHFEGPIPTSIAHMSGLLYLDLSYNNFSRELPTRLVNDCNSIRILQLSDNNLEGNIIPEDMNLPYLERLKLSNNRFGGTIKDTLLKSSANLLYLDVSNNSITGRLPQWIGNFFELRFLSISQNKLQGHIPTEICNLHDLEFLDFSLNNFSGSIPSCPHSCSLSQVDLHSNSLSGIIPTALSTCTYLKTLHLGDNQLSGGIPLWIHKLSSLTILKLAGNNLHGPIPQQLCQLSGINLLDVSRNGLSGGIPSCIHNLSFGNLSIYNVPYTMMISPSTCPYYFYSKPEEVEFFNKNHPLVYKGTDLVLMSLLDLSSNKLIGDIPPQLGKLEQLHALNLSRNFLSGSIPSHFSNLQQVESLDLSFNHLNGKIPSQLVELTFLEIFNVSYNNLSRRVPDTGQFANFDKSNYYGNPGLHGYHPIKALPPSTGNEEDEDENEDDQPVIYMVDFLWSFSMSCVTMFLATIFILYINPGWRGALFGFVDSHILCWFTKFKLNSY